MKEIINRIPSEQAARGVQALDATEPSGLLQSRSWPDLVMQEVESRFPINGRYDQMLKEIRGGQK